jgi:hypothetical protein
MSLWGARVTLWAPALRGVQLVTVFQSVDRGWKLPGTGRRARGNVAPEPAVCSMYFQRFALIDGKPATKRMRSLTGSLQISAASRSDLEVSWSVGGELRTAAVA